MGRNLQWDKIKIGQNRWRDANYKGYIDEFKIYGRAFTAPEVANLYNFTLPPAVESINVSGQGGSTLRLTWDEVDGAIDYTIFQAEKSSGGLTNVITFTNPNSGYLCGSRFICNLRHYFLYIRVLFLRCDGFDKQHVLLLSDRCSKRTGKRASLS